MTCIICGQSCDGRMGLEYHAAEAHGLKQEMMTPVANTEEGLAQKQCNICGRVVLSDDADNHLEMAHLGAKAS